MIYGSGDLVVSYYLARLSEIFENIDWLVLAETDGRLQALVRLAEKTNTHRNNRDAKPQVKRFSRQTCATCDVKRC